MQQLLSTEVLWGVSVLQLALSAAVLVLSLFSRRLVRGLFGRAVVRRTLRARSQWAADLFELMPPPLGLLVQMLLWAAAVRLLVLPQDPVDVRGLAEGGLLLAAAVAITWALFRLLDVVSRYAMRSAERTATRLDDQLVPLLRKTVKVILAVVMAVSVLDKLDYEVTSLIASLSVGGLALALAAKDTIANVFGSLVVFADQPFQVGDWVDISGVEGIVEEVGIRTTRIRRFDQAVATIPNQSFTGTTIVNHSRRSVRRIRHEVGLTYDTSPEQMEMFVDSVRRMLESMPELDAGRSQAYFKAYDPSSLTVLVQTFSQSSDYGDYMAAQERVLLGVLRLADEQGLQIAFPTRTVYLENADQTARRG